MAKVIVGMTVSLDGFANDRNSSVARLSPDLAALRKAEVLQEKGSPILREPRRRSASARDDHRPEVAEPYGHQVPGRKVTGADSAASAARDRSIRATIRRVRASIAA